MAYSDDAVKAKLSALNETQDSIVTVAQWIMFHRRHADRTASLWLARLQDSSVPKRLNLVYLANEVVQQSRARGKQDFRLAFEPLIADATGLAYKHASQEVQQKLKRVVEVWRQRNIFDPRIQDATEARIVELDKVRGSGKSNGGGGGRLGGSLFGGSSVGGNVPADLEAVAKSQTAVFKAETGMNGSTAAAHADYVKMTDPSAAVPTPPVHAARLSSLVRTLATAQNAVEASIKERRNLLEELEKLVAINRAKLLTDEQQASELQARKDGIESKKKEVEDAIMRGLSAPSTPAVATPSSTSAYPTNGMNGEGEPSAPEPESFTPPPPDVEAFTPPANDPGDIDDDTTGIGEVGQGEQMLADTTGAEHVMEQPPNPDVEPAPSYEPPPAALQPQPSTDAEAQANDFLSSLIAPSAMPVGSTRSASGEALADPRLKRRKMSHRSGGDDVDEDIFGKGAVAGMDEDGIAAMLEQ